tara:strand:+ start:258 stop:1442 length:1185 start_codon:yes stop_codon:yes gene_type:complete
MERMAIETEEDYQKLINKLEEFDVEVLRLDVSDNVDDYKDYDGVVTAPPPMCPRDFSAMIGDTFYMPSENYGTNFDVDALYLGMLNAEPTWTKGEVQENREGVLAQYLEDLLQPGRPLSQEAALKAFRSRDDIVKQPYAFLAAVDREELEKVIIAAETNTIGSNVKFPTNRRVYAWTSVRKWLEKNNVPTVYDQYISSANCWRLGKDLYFNYVNLWSVLNQDRFQEKWNKLFPDYRNHAISVPGHGDGAMHPVKEGLIIAAKEEKHYKDYYPGWEVVTVKDYGKMRPFLELKNKNRGRWWIKGEENNDDLIDYIDTWLDHWVTYAEETIFDLNVLPINEQNCIVNGYNKNIFDAFERHGITPHVVNFRHRWFWDGGLHCITSDIHREGKQKTFW